MDDHYNFLTSKWLLQDPILYQLYTGLSLRIFLLAKNPLGVKDGLLYLFKRDKSD